MKVKEESEKVGLKLNIQKTKIMASGPITSWQIDGETVTDFILGDSKITARRSNQSILKEISPGCSLEGLMLKLKFQYFGHLMGTVDSLEKTLMLGGIGGRKRRGRQRMDGWMASPTLWTWVCVNSGSLWWTGRPDVLRFMGLQRVGHDWVTELNWTGDMEGNI